MTDLSPVPARIVQAVNEFARRERGQVEQYDNRAFFDSSGMYDLHTLARTVYAAGWTEGHLAAAEEERGNRA